MARKTLSAWETEQKKLFNEAIKKYSVQAVENIWKIANTSMDSKVRLSANIWIAEKFVGKDYHVWEEETNQKNNNITIGLFLLGNHTNQTKKMNRRFGM